MIVFFIFDCLLLAFALVVLAIGNNQFFLNRTGHGMVVAAMVCGLFFTIHTFLLSDPLNIVLFAHSSLGTVSLRFDKLSLFFLGLIQVGGIVTSTYGIGYLSHYERLRSLKPTLTATVLLFFSMQILIVANHAFLFLVAWELMALSGYLGIVLEREKEEVQRGSFIFFAATHIGTLFLYIMFLLLHQQTNSWEFSTFAHHTYLPSVITTIFWFGFIGFGMKAGFMPFHFWLPEAHPVAPSHISAVLSAIMLKTGIYGLIRVITWTHPIDFFIPSTLLMISSVTAIFGIWNALAQKDLKRMLAYSSIENIGIIGIALSIMMFGMQHQQPLVTFLGLSGALFHTANHFVFKSLLFMSAGTIYHHYHHRDIEQMGGLMKSAPLIGGIVLIGSVAICGLPPFNGFASEFLIYSGFFDASSVLHAYFPFFMLIAAVALAFVGGLAVVGFSKNFSMIFLGSPKTASKKPFHFSWYERVPLSFLTVLIVVLGLFPQSIVGICATIFNEQFPSSQPLSWISPANSIQSVGMIALAVLIVISMMVIVKRKLVARRSTRISVPWGCGYNAVTARMQYSGTSFSNEIVNIAGQVLNVEKEIRFPMNSFPQQSIFRTSVQDLVLYKIIVPITAALSWTTDLFKWLQSGKIQVYITFSIAILALYLFLAIFM
ncbi:MAG: proton-conducting transporter membrane subunit [Bacteroidota bacterium]|nr:proton-conducting transporter membrane subunit [Bacteroidota bacterium]